MNIYLKRYFVLISHFQNTIIDGYGENHHIIPRCLGGIDKKSNIVMLPAKAHYVAHHLLHKAYPDNRKLAYAFGMMLCKNDLQERVLSARMYEKARLAISKASKGRKRPDLAARNKLRCKLKSPKEPKPKRTDHFFEYNNRKKIEGYTQQELEAKSRAGKARKGVQMSEEGRKSYSIAAIKRQQFAPQISCTKCGHTQKRSPNFYRYHENNCVI